jgi:uncharacterized protein YyaL (SSP411 family)
MRLRTALLSLSGLFVACTPAVHTAPVVSGAPAIGGAPAASAVVESAAPLETVVAWNDMTPAVFARAKAEHKLVVLDGAAEWCHWCHVMDATTYHDPSVVAVLREKFIAVKVDIDARPDIEERYGDWGWPATVLFSAEGDEIGKFKGYIEPERFTEILRTAVASGTSSARASEAVAMGTGALPAEEVAWIARLTELELADYEDDAEGGWGKWQKAPLAWDDAWTLAKGRGGDEKAKKLALLTLDKERALLDPVWGGMYQYSAGSDWTHPHFEKLMDVQAGAIVAYSEAYLLTHDGKWLEAARAETAYVARFMTGGDGGFYTTQDADLNAHEVGKTFVDGHTYYAKNERDRLALGVPRIDVHEYGHENGLMIAALATLYEATHDSAALAAAEKAAGRVLASHAAPGGGVFHDVARPEVTSAYLADNAAMAWGLVRLYEVTNKAEHLDAAVKVADFIAKQLFDAKLGGLATMTANGQGVGVFATRRVPFDDGAVAIRALAHIARAKKTDAYDEVIASSLRAIATPDAIKERGRMLGSFLFALDEARKLPPAAPAPPPHESKPTGASVY